MNGAVGRDETVDAVSSRELGVRDSKFALEPLGESKAPSSELMMLLRLELSGRNDAGGSSSLGLCRSTSSLLIEGMEELRALDCVSRASDGMVCSGDWRAGLYVPDERDGCDDMVVTESRD